MLAKPLLLSYYPFEPRELTRFGWRCPKDEG
jgi:hypothetical protein